MYWKKIYTEIRESLPYITVLAIVLVTYKASGRAYA